MSVESLLRLDSFPKALVVSGVVHGINKFASYITSQPSEFEREFLNHHIFEIRKILFNIKETTAEVLGEHGWFIFSEMVVKNAWISVFALHYLFLNPKNTNYPLTLDQQLAGITCIYTFAYPVYFTRIGLCYLFPGLQDYIGQKNFFELVPKKTDEPVEHEPVDSKENETKVNVYEKLAVFMNASEANRADTTSEDEAQSNFSLLSLKEIPPVLHEDEVFKQYICPITREPIRHPIGDPDGKTIYEEIAIKIRLRLDPTSPLTQKLLKIEQLIRKPDLQLLINNRLKFHEKKLRSYLEEKSRVDEKS